MKTSRRFSMLIIGVAVTLISSAVLGATCDRSGDDSTQETPTPVAGTPAQSPTAPPTVTAAPTPTPLPTATPTPTPLSGAEIFSLVSPNVPIVFTGSGLGSGVLIPGGYIVTNAHVVWGYPNVLVKFPNSDSHRTLPVVGLDLMADLAVIGPVNMPLEGLELHDGEDLAIGSDVFLVGYPDEVEIFPDEPTISRGVISRFRQWPTLGLTLIQSDAVAAGGQSGGVMVSESGEVIGITTATFGDGDFVIATSAKDIRERVDGLIQGEDVDGLRDRRLPSRGATEHNFRLTDRWDSRIAVLYEPPETEIEIRLESDKDSAFDVVDVFAEVILEVDDTESGVERGSTMLETFGPHFVRFEQFSSEPGEFVLETSHDLAFIDDKDDHRRVSVEESVVGNVDAPFDEDYFELQLDAGDSVTISVESFMMNPFVRVARADWTTAAVSDDNGGGGVVGEDAFLSFTAPESGTYIILVSDSWDTQVGGYFLRIDWAPRRAVSPLPTEPPAIPPVTSPHGPMATYANSEYDFSIQYPTDWPDFPVKSAWEGVESQFRGDDDEFLTVRIHDLPRQGLGGWSLDDYVDFWVSWIESDEIGGEITANIEYGNIGGKPARLLTYTHSDTQSVLLIFVNDQKIAYSAGYDLRLPPAEDTLRMVKYSFSTFTVRGQALQDLPDFPPIETDSPPGAAAAPEAAPEPIWFAPMATYRDEENSLSIQFPADWTPYGSEQTDVVTFESDYREFFSVFTDNSRRTGTVYRTLDEYVDWLVDQLESTAGYEIVQISDYGEINGLPARLLFHTNDELERHLVNLVFLSEQQVGSAVSYDFPASLTGELAPMIEYSFGSIAVDGNPLTNTPDFPNLQNAFSSATVPSTETAQPRGRFMPMATYDHDEYSFSILYPADWKAFDGGDSWAAQFSSYKGDDLLLSFVDPRNSGLGDLTLDEHVDDLLSIIESEDIGHQVPSTSRFGQIAGLPVHLVVLVDHETDSLQTHLLHVDKGGVLYQIVFLLNTSGIEDLLQTLEFEDFLQTVEYSLRSITVDGNPLTDAPEFPSLDSVSLGDTQSPPESSRQQNPLGPLATYRDDQFAFSVEYPAGWQAVSPGRGWTAVFENHLGDALRIAIDGDWDGLNQWNAYREAASLIEYYKARDDRVRVLSHLRYGDIDGLPARLLVFGTDTRLSTMLVYISKDGARYTIGYFSGAPRFNELAPLFEHSFGSIMIDGKSLTDIPEFPSLASLTSDDSQLSPDSSLTPSPFGPMATYRDDEFAFSIQYPDHWRIRSGHPFWDAEFFNEEEDTLALAVTHGEDFGGSDLTLDETTANAIAGVISEDGDRRIVSNSRYGEIDGLPAQLLIFSAGGDATVFAMLIYFSDDSNVYTIAFGSLTSRFNQLIPLFEYSLRSIAIDGNHLINTPEFPSPDTASSDEAQPPPQSALIQSPFGPMATYRDHEFAFSIQYPADWEVVPEDDDWKARFLGGGGAAVGIGIQDFTGETPVGLTPEQHHELVTDVIIEHWLPAALGHRILSNSDFGVIDGRPVHLALVATLDSRENIAVLTYLSANGVSYRAVFEIPASGLDQLVPMFDYLIRSITIDGKSLTDTPGFPSFETVSSNNAQPSPESSLIQSPHGPMATYRNEEFAFAIQYPADWNEVAERGDFSAKFEGDETEDFSVSFRDYSSEGQEKDVPAALWANEFVARWTSTYKNARIFHNSGFGQIDGRPAQLLVLSNDANTHILALLVYISQDQVLYRVYLTSAAERFNGLAPVFEYAFRSIIIGGKPLTNAPEFPSVQTAPSADAQPASDTTDAQNPFGPMATYSDDEVAFTIQYPASWYQIAEAADPGGVQFSNLASGTSAALLGFWTVQLSETVRQDLALDWYTDYLVTEYVSEHDAQAVSNSRYGEIDGRPAQLVVFRTEGGARYLATLFYASEDLLVYNITFAAYVLRFEEFAPLFEYSFRSITINGKPLINTPEFPRVG